MVQPQWQGMDTSSKARTSALQIHVVSYRCGQKVQGNAMGHGLHGAVWADRRKQHYGHSRGFLVGALSFRQTVEPVIFGRSELV